MELKKLVGLSSYRLVNSLRSGIFYAFLVLYLRDLGLSVFEASLLTSLSEVISSISQFFIWGPLSDRFQKRMPFIIGGQLGAAICYLVVFFVHKELMGVSLRITGLFLVFSLSAIEFLWSAPQVCWSALLSDIVAPQERPTYLGRVFSIMSTGRVIGLVASGFLYELGGSEGSGFSEGYLFYLLIIGILISVTVNILTIKDAKRTPNHLLEQNSSGTIDHIDQIEQEEKKTSKKYTESEKKNTRLFYWLLIALVFTQFAQSTGLQTFLYYARLDPIKASAVAISFIVAAKWIGFGVFSPISGYLTRKLGKPTILIGMILMTVPPFLFKYITTVWQAMVLMGLQGVALSILFTSGYIIVSDIVPESKRGRSFGLYNGVRASTWGLGPTLFGGPIADYKLNQGATEAEAYSATFLVAGLLGLIAVGVYAGKLRKGLSK